MIAKYNAALERQKRIKQKFKNKEINCYINLDKGNIKTILPLTAHISSFTTGMRSCQSRYLPLEVVKASRLVMLGSFLTFDFK